MMLLTIVFTICCSGEKIAIIGGGVGGHYLSKLLNNNGDTLTLYESSQTECGRVRTVQFDGKYFEAGGSIIHPANKHAIQIMKNYNLQRKTVGDSLPGILGAGNDGHLKWSFLPSGSIFDIVKFLYFYGVDILYRIPTMVHPLIAKLDGIYKLQQDGYGYKSFNELFSRLGLLDYTKLSGEEMFQSIPKKTRDEIISAVMMNNYSNQTLSFTTGLVTSVSLAGFDGDLFGIIGGNQQLCIALKNDIISKSPEKFTYKQETVDKVEITDDGKIIVMDDGPFDKLVLAGPINIQIPGVNYPQYEMEYQRTVATFVRGKINEAYLRCSPCPNLILVSDTGRIATNIYKVFSDSLLTTTQLGLLFSRLDESMVVDWAAYPKYNYNVDLNLKFELIQTDTYSIYTTQPIELGASCIEMSLISAANVAALIVNQTDANTDHAKEEL